MTVRYELVGVPATNGRRARWPFGSPTCPLRLASTPTGLGGAPRTHARQKNARQAGATWRGTDFDINPIGLDVHIGPVTPGDEALDLHARWRDSLGIGDELAEFHVYGPLGHRWQHVRLEDPLPDPDLFSLEVNGYTREQPKLTSDQAFWFADPVSTPLLTPAQFAGAALYNRGDIDAHPVYELHGPGVFTVGTPAEHHTLPALVDGEVWRIDTNPDDPSVRNGAGVDVWDRLGVRFWYAGFPRRRTTPLTLAVTGASETTAARVTLPQYYARAQ